MIRAIESKAPGLSNMFTYILLSPVAFDSITQITLTWMNENVHRKPGDFN